MCVFGKGFIWLHWIRKQNLRASFIKAFWLKSWSFLTPETYMLCCYTVLELLWGRYAGTEMFSVFGSSWKKNGRPELCLTILIKRNKDLLHKVIGQPRYWMNGLHRSIQLTCLIRFKSVAGAQVLSKVIHYSTRHRDSLETTYKFFSWHEEDSKQVLPGRSQILGRQW